MLQLQRRPQPDGKRERNCADTVGTVLRPWAGRPISDTRCYFNVVVRNIFISVIDYAPSDCFYSTFLGQLLVFLSDLAVLLF